MISWLTAALASICIASGAFLSMPCRAQTSADTYSLHWDKGPPSEDKRGWHEEAVIIYLHGRSGNSMEDAPVPLVFQLLADRLRASLARIVRPPAVDSASNDPAIIDFIRAQAKELRSAGVRRILVAGVSRGGWLAIKSGREISEIDEVLAIAPATYGLTAPELEAQAAAINKMLSSMQAQRIALFFFENDPREAVSTKRGDTARAVLRELPLSFLIEDHAQGLSGHGAVGLGRFSRRYLDCLTRFFGSNEVPKGEQHCDLSSGYAVASEIKFPNVSPARPRDVTAGPVRPFAGRWEGDDEYGRYSILASSEFFEDGVTFLFGHSSSPGNGTVKPWIQELKFIQTKADPSVLEHVSDRMKVTFTVKLIHENELQLTMKFHGDDRVYAPMFLKRRPSM